MRGCGLPAAARRHRADFDEAEAQRRQRADVRAVLVEAGGEAHRVGKVDAHHVHGFARCARQQAQQADPVREIEAGEGEAVGILGVEREQGGADQRIEHGSGSRVWRRGTRVSGSAMRVRYGRRHDASLTGRRRRLPPGGVRCYPERVRVCAHLPVSMPIPFLLIDKPMTTPYLLQRLVLLFGFLIAPAAWSAAAVVPPSPQLAAKSWVLMDAASGNVAGRPPGQSAPAARQPDQADDFARRGAGTSARPHQGGRPRHISEKAWRMGGSKMFVKVGNQVAVHDLLRGIIVQSGNDASIALAEHLAGGEDTFAARDEPGSETAGPCRHPFRQRTAGRPKAIIRARSTMAKLAGPS